MSDCPELKALVSATSTVVPTTSAPVAVRVFGNPALSEYSTDLNLVVAFVAAFICALMALKVSRFGWALLQPYRPTLAPRAHAMIRFLCILVRSILLCIFFIAAPGWRWS